MAVKRAPLDSRGITDLRKTIGTGVSASPPVADHQGGTVDQIDGQQGLRLAPEDVCVQARYVAGGWHLQIAVRHQGEPWGDSSWTHYDHLTTTELIQVVEDHLSSQL